MAAFLVGFLFHPNPSLAQIASRSSILKANPALDALLKQYEKDQQKYKAALFLIDNLPYHSSAQGKSLRPFLRQYDLLSKPEWNYQQVRDSVAREFGTWSQYDITLKSDVYIDAGYLKDNIDWAFKVWREQPWGKNVSFDTFCEMILPYRVGNEALKPWREKIYNRYMPIIRSLKKDPRIVQPEFVAQAVIDSLFKPYSRFTSEFASDIHAGPDLVDWRCGSCQDLTDMTVYVLRALGIPCSVDEMKIRGDNNVSHFWNVTVDSAGKAWFFSILYPAHKLEDTETYWNPKGKVYRQTFGLNKEIMAEFGLQQNMLHPSFRYPCFKDVTKEYSGKKNRMVHISSRDFYFSVPQGQEVYMCLPSWRDWIPVGYGFVEGDSVRVRNVEGDIVFRLAVYDAEHDKLRLLTDPYCLNREDGCLRRIQASSDSQDITLYYKFRLSDETLRQRLVGGVFEGSNTPDFSQRDTLFVIREAPYRLVNYASVSSEKSYRYVRYFGPKEGHCNISEAVFFGSDGAVLLKGKVIGTDNCSDGDHTFRNVFDGDNYTSFDAYPDSGCWAGLDLGRPMAISKVMYVPRNFDNFIRKGDVYELFYTQGDRWVSAGRKTADSDELHFSVPKGALLYLKDYTRGSQERIFEYNKPESLTFH